MGDTLIKGMKMPKYCAECDLNEIFSKTPYCRRLLQRVPLGGRLENCPLVEVPHWHWVGIDDYPFETWECDRCGHIENGDDVQERCHYCPNCGAKMEIEQDD